MAVIWQNSFDGEPLTVVSDDPSGPGSSGEWGDPIVNLRNTADVTRVRYGDQSYIGRASLMLGDDVAESGNHGEVQITPASTGPEWSVSLYIYRTGDGWFRFLQDGRVGVSDLYLDYSSGYGLVGATMIDEDAFAIIADQWVRIEASQLESDIEWSFWWTDPDSTGPPDYSIYVDSVATGGYLFVQGGGSSAEHPPVYVDQVRVGDGEWLGPWPIEHGGVASANIELFGVADGSMSSSGSAVAAIELYGRADGEGDGTINRRGPGQGVTVLYGQAGARIGRVGAVTGGVELFGSADGFEGGAVATSLPVSDLWIGPLGMMHQMQRRAEWERAPELGVDQHVSLHGVVTTSRARQRARVSTLSWEHLDRRDADAIEEIAVAPAREDTVVAVVDPDAAQGNLLTAEQSRGRPGPGQPPASLEHLYRLTGPGALAHGVIQGRRLICVQDPEPGGEVTWLHPYHGERGWPVMPGWPVYLSLSPEDSDLAPMCRIWLRFYDWFGNFLTSATGDDGGGSVEADAPVDAVTVSPRMIIDGQGSGMWAVGSARLSLAPHTEDYIPLGNGSPMYSVVGFSDSPYIPWRSVSLDLQEVRSNAYR